MVKIALMACECFALPSATGGGADACAGGGISPRAGELPPSPALSKERERERECSSGETNFADLLNRHNMPRGTYPPTESTQPATTDAEPTQPTKAQTYYPYWDPRKSARQRGATAAEARRASETWPVHQHLLRAANSIQATHYRQMMHLNRQATESWSEWHVRSLRTARARMHREGMQRWSTFILQRIWSLWGHMARGGDEVNNMIRWKDLRFWRAEQQKPARTRVRHAGRFNPGGDVERAIEAIAGTSWGEVAQQRQVWQALQQRFVERLDVPWATGRQGSIHDNLHPQHQQYQRPPKGAQGRMNSNVTAPRPNPGRHAPTRPHTATHLATFKPHPVTNSRERHEGREQ